MQTQQGLDGGSNLNVGGVSKSSASATLGPSSGGLVSGAGGGGSGGEVTTRAQSEPILPAMLVAGAISPSSPQGNVPSGQSMAQLFLIGAFYQNEPDYYSGKFFCQTTACMRSGHFLQNY